MPPRRTFLLVPLAALIFITQQCATSAADKESPQATKYVRVHVGQETLYGILEDGDKVRLLKGNLFDNPAKTDTVMSLADVLLLPPTTPTQVIAMAGNYKSHLAGEEIPEKFKIPQAFFKSPSCLVPHEGYIVLPKDATSVHYEAEMVIVIGRKASKVSKEDALSYVFGVTCGNDVSERVWQKADVQWWRAKGSDTFGPCGPCIVSGLDYDNLEIKLRVNGEEKQKANTGELIHGVADLVSFISKHVTLHPGDLIYTGTPGKTSDLKVGDIVEVDLEGVGVLRNVVTAEQ
jgi:2-keto-4-pentenoate hydratase/2-oxohepta-3-ene-1,7-dioic acid hydratase in catechol pathway